MNILVVGFGNMGCRHAQAFLRDSKYRVSVIEPNGDIFNTNLARIGATKENIRRISFSECTKDFFDFAIIATSAEIRLSLFKEVLAVGVKNIVLEKVVFQSRSQFDEALILIERYGAKVYCNFLNRYSKSYNEIRNSVSSPLVFTVTGGHFGFACNALHYIDLFKYLTGSEIELVVSRLKKSENPNIRGDKYVEVFGQQIWETDKGDRLFISSDSENNSGKGSENHFNGNGLTYIINENTLNQFNIDEKGGLEIFKFDMPMASSLSETLYLDILNGTIKLPDVKETMDYHIQFFESINNVLGLSNISSCPIT